MKLDVLGQTVLQDIQKHAGFNRAIIAGGFCRDQIMGGKFKDIDIFVPALSFDQIFEFLADLPEDWKLITQRPIQKTDDGYSIVEHISDIIDFKYMDCIDVQVMNTKIPDEDGFGLKVLEGFNYGIDKVFSDGDLFFQHEDQTYDVNRSCATLVDRSISLYSLPHHMKKFFRLQEKYPNLTFRCPYIKFESPEPNKKPMIDYTDYRPWNEIPIPVIKEVRWHPRRNPPRALGNNIRWNPGAFEMDRNE